MVIDEIAEFILSSYPNKESGIVYCFSRKECEQVRVAISIWSWMICNLWSQWGREFNLAMSLLDVILELASNCLVEVRDRRHLGVRETRNLH